MKPEDDDLDADLRALFADQRLDVPVGQEAVGSVVAGAHRLRRRRTAVLATGGALGVAMVLLAGGLFAGHVLPTDHTQAANPSLSTSSYLTPTPDQTGPRPVGPDVVNVPSNAPTVIGPTGYGDITMGMTAKQVQQTGLVNTPISGIAGCTGYTYIAPTQSRPSASAVTEGQSKSIYVYLGTRAPSGVQVIIAPAGVTTPEGIGVGSSVATIRVTYPNLLAQKGDVLPVPVPDHPGLSYRFTVVKDTVNSIALDLTGGNCQQQ